MADNVLTTARRLDLDEQKMRRLRNQLDGHLEQQRKLLSEIAMLPLGDERDQLLRQAGDREKIMNEIALELLELLPVNVPLT